MIPAENYREEYAGNDVATDFDYHLPIPDKNYLLWTLVDISNVETTLVVDVDYTVSGVNDANTANWYITYPVAGSPLATGEKLVGVPNFPFIQLTDLTAGGPYSAEVIETALDNLTIQNQQQQEELDRCYKVSVGGNPADSSDLQNAIAAAEAAAIAAALSAAAAANSISVPANTIKANATSSTAIPTDLSLIANTFLGRSSTGNISVKSITDNAFSILTLSALNTAMGGRLTAGTGAPLPVGDNTAVTTIYYTPFSGSTVSLYSGTVWNVYNFIELALSLSGFTASKNYDIWLYNNAGTLTLDSTVWTNDTTRATSLTRQDGVLVKNADATRRYLGTIGITGSTGQTEDSIFNRFIWNYYNRILRFMNSTENTGSWNYSTNTYRQANNSTANQISFVRGVDEDVVIARARSTFTNSTSTFRQCKYGIGLDSTTAISSHSLQSLATMNNAGSSTLEATFSSTISAGRHYLASLEAGAGSDTQTWNGSGINTGIMGEIFC